MEGGGVATAMPVVASGWVLPCGRSVCALPPAMPVRRLLRVHPNQRRGGTGGFTYAVAGHRLNTTLPCPANLSNPVPRGHWRPPPGLEVGGGCLARWPAAGHPFPFLGWVRTDATHSPCPCATSRLRGMGVLVLLLGM